MYKVIILGGDQVPAACEYCGVIEELRPYGRNGAKICFDCGMKDENIATTDAAFAAILDGTSNNPSPDQQN